VPARPTRSSELRIDAAALPRSQELGRLLAGALRPHAGLAAAVAVGRGVLDDPGVMRDLWLVPLRDFVALAVWVVSFLGDEVEWRAMRFRVRDGKLEKI